MSFLEWEWLNVSRVVPSGAQRKGATDVKKSRSAKKWHVKVYDIHESVGEKPQR